MKGAKYHRRMSYFGGLRRKSELHTTLPLPAHVRQIDILQILRAVAVTLVAWGHAGLFPAPHRVLPSLNIYGIDVFFVISGFIMSHIVLRSKDRPGVSRAGDFLLRRLIRIFPIYWIYAGLGLIQYWHSHGTGWSEVPSLFLVPLPQYPRIFDLSWTLMFEMFFYITMAVILLVTSRYAVPVLIAGYCGAVLLTGPLAGRPPFLRVALNPMLLEFGFGAAVALALKRFGHRKRPGITALIAGSALAIYLWWQPPAFANDMATILGGGAVLGRVLTWGLSAALVVGGAVFWSPDIRSKAGRMLVVLGNASYSAYMASTLVLEFGLRLLFRLFPPHIPVSLGWTVFYQGGMTVAVLLAGWLSYQFIEWPLVRLLQRRVRFGARRDRAPQPILANRSV